MINRTRPKEIAFIKRLPLNETFKEFDVWLRKIEDAIPNEDELKKVLITCKEHYGEEFGEIFNEKVLPLLHDNYHDICLWELHESFKYD